MMQPSTHAKLREEFSQLLKPFKAESIGEKCVDIVVRERMKILSSQGHSDRSTGEWISPNPHADLGAD